MTRQHTLALALAVVAMLVAGSSFAATLKIGDAPPDWSGLPGVDGKNHSLSDYKEAKLVVLVFNCNTCPVAKAYEDRLIALQKDYQEKGVQLIVVGVNDVEQDRLPAMKKRAAGEDLGNWRTSKLPFNFPYLYDETQKIGRDYSAKTTPHVFVFDQNLTVDKKRQVESVQRRIVYMGAVDDSMDPKGVKVHYLRDTLDYLLKGNRPVTKEFGCTIKWKKGTK